MIQARLQFSRGDFSLAFDECLPERGVTAIFGASASGKTTLLRCIAGLEHAVGSLQVNGEVWQDATHFVPTHQRRLGYVSQQANLFPHLSVRKNLEYGWHRTPLHERKVSLAQAVAWLGLEKIIDRDEVEKLSGGERQRVAIARALLASPRILLMDEPLAALDYASRQEILPYLATLHNQLMIPVLYVSHSLDEVARFADHMVLLEDGHVLASGPMHETLSRLDLPTARLEDAGVVIDAKLVAHDEKYHLSLLDFAGGHFWVGEIANSLESHVRVRILARDVSVTTELPVTSSINNVLSARIIEVAEFGRGKVMLRMTLSESQILLSYITTRSLDRLGLFVGMDVYAQFKSAALIV